jgi:glucose/arabinose dehydrogenase
VGGTAPGALPSGDPAAPPAASADPPPSDVAIEAVGEPAPAPVTVALTRVLTGLTQPVQVVTHGSELYVVEQTGRVVRSDAGGVAARPVIDLSDRMIVGAEMGLLSMAFHPRFDENGQVFLYYTAPPPAGVTGIDALSVIERFESHDEGLTLDPASERRILAVNQPGNAHKGGTVAFGMDGLLYWSLGDGAYGSDPFHTAQDVNDALGSILRIDVDGGVPYAIPPDNPFAHGGGLPEIYALGFRNPFRMSFDRVTGDLWVGDVGEASREEIDRVIKGGNYGWPVREGSTCYAADTCATAGFIDPVVEHTHDEAVAIIGGVVYRGSGIPDLAGSYVYGDWVTGNLFGFHVDASTPTPARLKVVGDVPHPTSFAIDGDGEIVLSSYDGFVYRVGPAVAPQ